MKQAGVAARKPCDNFVALRLLLALVVLVTHFKVLSGGALLGWLPTSPEFAVAGFFVISGYVITASYDRLPVAAAFYCKRLFRMYPLYAAVIVAQAIGMVLFFTHPLADHMPDTVRYLCANLLMLNFLQYDIGGLLSHALNPGINPSLWTLKIEVMFYAVVPLLCLCFYRFRLAGLAAIYLLSVLYTEAMQAYGQEEWARQLPGALRLIAVGMALYFYRHKLQVPPAIVVPVAVAGFCLLEFSGAMSPALYPLLVGPVILLLATRIPLPRLTTDLSYGVYLLHAPLIQFSLLTGIFRDTYGFLALLTLACCALAYAGYRLIELPGIALGHRVAKLMAKKGLCAHAFEPPAPMATPLRA